MKNAKLQGDIKGVKVTPSEISTHLLFVDDVLLFGFSSQQEFQGLQKNY